MGTITKSSQGKVFITKISNTQPSHVLMDLGKSKINEVILHYNATAVATDTKLQTEVNCAYPESKRVSYQAVSYQNVSQQFQ